ncbi:type II toxin-antitoxin system HicA family toxin [Candidatus Berkelbacteria bacterium]|nr:type II toxin-antitoxin system HicA family toxin [Candidatus Berkelbacteria bacterium]
MHPLPAKKLIKILKKHGFELTRQRGNHQILYNSQTGATVPVPIHGGNRPINVGTFMAIVNQSKLPRKVFSD